MTPPRAPARPSDVADELRRIIEAAASMAPGSADLDRALALATELRAVLGDERGPRWYDAADDDPDGESGAYLDQSPFRGRLNPLAPPLDLEVIDEDGEQVLRGSATLGVAYEGPPHGLHGGIVAGLFDDLLGATQRLAEQRGVTATLEVHYRAITPIDRALEFRGWIDRTSGRRTVARATCHAGEMLTAEAKALFVAVDFDPTRANAPGGLRR